MRCLANVLAVIVATGCLALPLRGAHAGGTVQGGYDEFAYTPAYPYGYHYACWYEPYGMRYCGLWRGGDRPVCPYGYYYTCSHTPNGYGNCSCY